MDEIREDYSDHIDQPLAHEAGINHTIDSPSHQLKAGNLHAANQLARRMLWNLEDRIDVELNDEGIIEVEE